MNHINNSNVFIKWFYIPLSALEGMLKVAYMKKKLIKNDSPPPKNTKPELVKTVEHKRSTSK